MRVFYTLIIIFSLSIIAGESAAEEKWLFELFYGGFVYNAPLPLKIEQRGEKDISITARYASRTLETPAYWVWRFSRWSGDYAWEFEAVHHKIFLRNEPDEVEHFSVSHGFNLLTINRSMQYGGLIFRAGGGMVLAHPESRIRGKSLSEHRGLFNLGYYIGGPSINLGIGKHFYLSKTLFLCIEIKATASYAHVPINDGNADIYNAAFHAHAGIGYNFYSIGDKPSVQ